MQPQMLLQRYETGKRDFSWADLQGADLSHQDLAEINLYRANLAGANLRGANLAKANLFKANLAAADLNGANLTGANLCKVDFQGAVIESACLDEAKLRGAILPDGSAYVSSEPEPQLEPEADEPEADVLEDFSVDDQTVTEAEAELLRSQIEACELIAVAELKQIPVWDTNDRLWCLGMVGVTAGFLCFGTVLNLNGVPLPVWLVVWASIFITEGKPESVWVVPVTAGAIATLFSDLSFIHLILTFFLVMLTGGGIFFYGSILGQQFKKTLQDGLFLLGFSFILLNFKFLVALGIVLAGFGFLYLLRDSKELGRLVRNKKRENDPWVRRRRLIEQKRFYKQFALAAALGLIFGGLGGLLF